MLLLASVTIHFGETLARAGESHWLGAYSTPWTVVFAALAGYGLVFAAAAAATGGVVTSLFRPRLSFSSVFPASVPFAALAVWQILRFAGPAMGGFEYVFGSIFLAGLCVYGIYSVRDGRGASVPVLCILIVMFVSACAAVHTFHLYPTALESELNTLERRFLAAWAFVAGPVAAVLYGRTASSFGGRLSTVLAVSSLALFVPAAPIVVAGPNRHPDPSSITNVLLITSDTMRADYLSLYGGRTPTPNLERMSDKGTNFTASHSLAPWTVPSLNGIFASKYPPNPTPGISSQEWSNLSVDGYQKIASYWTEDDGRSFVKRLGVVGYQTSAVVANQAITLQSWLVDSFDDFRFVAEKEEVRAGFLRSFPLLHAAVRRVYPPWAPVEMRDTTGSLTEYALHLLNRYRQWPFFLWIHYFDPHIPYHPPSKYRSTSAYGPSFPFADTPSMNKGAGLDAAQQEAARALYEGEIRYVDEAVGRILDEVERLGLESRTVVCFTSDHGEELWDRGNQGHGHRLYDELTRVPMIWTGAGVRTQSIDTPVSGIDIIPTLAELIGSPPASAWHGSSLANALLNGPDEPHAKPVFTGACYHFGVPNSEPLIAVRDRELKLIRGLNSGRQQLFNVERDPQEQANLAPKHPAKVEGLGTLLDQWMAAYPSTFSQHEEIRAEDTPSQEAQDVFRSLGYLE